MLLNTFLYSIFCILLNCQEISNFESSNDIEATDLRIIGGKEVSPPFKYPWMATIMRYESYWCGGALVANKYIVTAAHCMIGEAAPLRNFEVQLHRHDLDKSSDDENGLIFKISKRVMHPGYDPISLDNDLAVLILNTTDKNRPSISLDTQLYHKPGRKAIVMGWGRKTPTTGPSPILNKVTVPIFNNELCSLNYKASNFNYTVNTELKICAGYMQGGKDACKGDSGSPLFTYTDSKPVLLGVASNGNDICGAPNLPGIYTRITHYKDWLNSIIRPNPQY